MVLEVDEEPLPLDWEVHMSRSQNRPYYFNTRTSKVYWVDAELPRGWSHQFDQHGTRFYFHIRNKQDTVSYDKPVLRQLSHPQMDREDEALRLRLPPHKTNSLQDLLSPGPPAEPEISSSSSVPAMSISNLVSTSPPASNLRTPSGTGDFSLSTLGKRSFEQMQISSSQTQVQDPTAAARFYNQLKRNAASDRAESLLFHMRSMNNWVKSILINEYSRPDDHVLDLACGKGGDLMKWAKRGIWRYVGADIAQKSLEDAVDRFLSNVQHRDLRVQFVQGDLGRVSLLDDALHCWTREKQWHDAVAVAEPHCFNVVSMQFSFHYMFGEEARAARFFRTLHEVLVDGGVFIATTVDPNMILHKYYETIGTKKTKAGTKTEGETEDDAPAPDVRILDEKQREVCCIRFDEQVRKVVSGFDAPQEGQFGLRYNFTLRDTDDAAGGDTAVDLPEYLVPDDLLEALLQKHGFELLLKQNFHPYILKNLEKNRSLLEKMHVMNCQGSISEAEWNIAGLYQVLAFRKAY